MGNFDYWKCIDFSFLLKKYKGICIGIFKLCGFFKYIFLNLYFFLEGVCDFVV